MSITRDEAMRELARRELQRRQEARQISEPPDTPPPSPRTGWGGVAEDIEELPGKAVDFAMSLPEKLSESGSQIWNDPGRAFKNLLAGVGETVESPINLLGQVGPYFRSRNIHNIGAAYLPKFSMPDFGIEKKMGLDVPQPGDEALRMTLPLIFGAKMLPKIPGVKTVTEGVKSMKELPALNKKVQEMKVGEKELSAKHEEATHQYRTEEDRYKALKDFLEQQPDYQSSDINVLTRKGAQTEKNLADLREKSLNIPEELRSTQAPKTPELTDLSLVKPEKANQIDLTNLPKTEISDEKVKQAENALIANQMTTHNVEKNFAENVLRKGYAHDIPVAEKVVANIEGVKNPATGRREGGVKQEIGQMYDQIENDLEDKNITLPQTKQLTDAQNSTRELLKDSSHLFKNDEDYGKIIAKNSIKSNPIDIVPAANVLSNYRTMRHLGQKLRQQAFSSKVASNKDLQADLLKRADEFETNARTLESALEKHDLGGSLDTLKQANKRWRTEVTPLYQNKTYKQFLRGTGPDNIIKALRGNGPGQDIIKNIIKNDPDLLRNVVGQQYAKNPEKLHEFDELTHEYTQHMPEVAQFKNVHHVAKQNEANAKMELEQAKHEYNIQRDQAAIRDRQQIEIAKQKNAEAKEQAKEKTRINKLKIKEENKKLQEEHKIRSESYDIQQEIKSHEDKHDKIKSNIEALRKKEQSTKMSLKEKLDVESKIKKHKNELKEVEDKINELNIKSGKLKTLGKWTIGLGATAIIGAPITSKIKSLISGS